MKIYIVTSGCYSDYHIEKVFTDKNKAEEYKEWLYDANDIEEYETEDDLIVNKFYNINVSADVYPNGILGPDVRIVKRLNTNNPSNYFYDYGKYFKLSINRCVAEENWNEEFYVNKYTKALYDLIAIVKYHLSNGIPHQLVNKLINEQIKEDE